MLAARLTNDYSLIMRIWLDLWIEEFWRIPVELNLRYAKYVKHLAFHLRCHITRVNRSIYRTLPASISGVNGEGYLGAPARTPEHIPSKHYNCSVGKFQVNDVCPEGTASKALKKNLEEGEEVPPWPMAPHCYAWDVMIYLESWLWIIRGSEYCASFAFSGCGNIFPQDSWYTDGTKGNLAP